MDAKKSGIRIKSAGLREDQKRWDQEKDQYRKHEQTVPRPGAGRWWNIQWQYGASSFSIDALLNIGSKDKVDTFKSRLRVYPDEVFNAHVKTGSLTHT
jgi:hypothetical protein